MVRVRLDELLVARGIYLSRARARDAILRGTVNVGGSLARRPGRPVAEDVEIAVSDPGRAYVSRAALKLVHALDHFGFSPDGLDCLDIGASTGGFTQVLLERGARHVTAVDVGHDQLDPFLRADPRVTVIEDLNARDLTSAHVARPLEIITCDVSFISLQLALPAALSLAAPLARLIALIKPQFEAGREALGKGGVVSDPEIHARVCGEIATWLDARGYHVIGTTPSPLLGGDGNTEFLIAAEKS